MINKFTDSIVGNYKVFTINYPYIIMVIFILVGLYLIVSSSSLLKKMVGLNLIQTGVIIFYILAAYIDNSVPPIIDTEETLNLVIANPIPQVLMLTAIVVGIATTALGYALLYKIYNSYSTIQQDKLMEKLKDK